MFGVSMFGLQRSSEIIGRPQNMERPSKEHGAYDRSGRKARGQAEQRKQRFGIEKRRHRRDAVTRELEDDDGPWLEPALAVLPECRGAGRRDRHEARTAAP